MKKILLFLTILSVYTFGQADSTIYQIQAKTTTATNDLLLMSLAVDSNYYKITYGNFINEVFADLHAGITNGDATHFPSSDNVYDFVTGLGYITATLTQEQVEDYVGNMLSANTETGITVTYQDADGTIDFVVTQDTTGLWQNVYNIFQTLNPGLDSNAVVATIADWVATNSDSSIYTQAEIDSLLALAGTALQSSNLNAFSDTLSYSWGVMDTTITGALPGWKVPNNITIVEISAYTDANTCTFNLEERGETTPNTAGTDVMASDLVADNDQQKQTSFSNAGIARDTWLVPTISATGDVEIFSITIRYIKTN